MIWIVVCGTALVAAGLTLFSGFGLGTLLLPAFALFFPVEVAVAATAVVHLANNLFKVALLGRHADWKVVAVFGIPGALAAFAGAALLTALADLAPLATWTLGGRPHEVTVVKLVVAALMLAFAVLDLVPALERLRIDRRWLPAGGLLSGFFGGLSGHQGALRAAFLTKIGLGAQAFVATGTVAAVLVDVTRLAVYGGAFAARPLGAALAGRGGWPLVAAAVVAAFLGSFLGARVLSGVTMRTIRWLVGGMLAVLSGALAAGLI